MNKTLYKNWLEKHFIPFYEELTNEEAYFLCKVVVRYCEYRKITLQDNVYLKFISSCIKQDVGVKHTLYTYVYQRYPGIDYGPSSDFWRRPARICYLRELAERITPHAVVKQTKTSTQSESEGESK